MNVRSYKKALREMNIGDTFYMNAISASYAMVDYTRECIKNGTIAPVRIEVERQVVPEAIDEFMSGLRIAPQMMYIKLK